MPMYRYVKELPRRSATRSVAISWLFMTSGLLVIIWTLWPIASFFLINRPLLSKIISPIGEGRAIVQPLNGILAPIATSTVNGNVLGDNLDYTNPNIWFPTSPQKKVVSRVNSYQLSIPKLKISNATVIIAGDDLKKSLIHYGGTALPGEYGNTVIFGHSTLPQFFDPTNYTTIFSTLPTLKIGDEILVTYDGITYRYAIYDMVVLKPTDLSPLEQRFDDSYLTLVTCVPPGTYWERLNVKARIVKPT